ncbi:MAG: SDR family oxidoreductase [Leptolyngbya sp. IPPAS B-1204]
MKVLVTGTEGYLGCLFAPLLLERGHEVTAVDTGFYKVGWLYNGTQSTAKTLTKDIRHITLEDLQGMDAVVHMAELSNDPTGQLAPHITYEINHKGSVRLAELAKQAGVRRFVYMSSCSVYGVATEGDVTEESPINPQTAYAECKALVERDVKPMADDDFSPTFMRNATAFELPRMRFDIVLNNLAGLAWTTKEIKMTSDGTPWRPLVHALDIAKALICVLEAPAMWFTIKFLT